MALMIEYVLAGKLSIMSLVCSSDGEKLYALIVYFSIYVKMYLTLRGEERQTA